MNDLEDSGDVAVEGLFKNFKRIHINRSNFGAVK